MQLRMDKIYYALNLAIAVVFVFLIVYPIGNYVFWQIKGASNNDMPLTTYAGAIVWYGYSIFCLKRLIRYLRGPVPDQHLDFIFFLLGLFPVGFTVFMLALYGLEEVGN